MDKQILKQILRDNQQEVERYVVDPRHLKLDDFPCRVLVGVRRAGKSYMLYHRIQQLLSEGLKWEDIQVIVVDDMYDIISSNVDSEADVIYFKKQAGSYPSKLDALNDLRKGHRLIYQLLLYIYAFWIWINS